MSIRRLSFYLSLAFLAVLLIGLPIQSQHVETQLVNTELISGRNVNMVSGTTLPGGDPWLQRQNEPSIAVSSRNPLHLLAGANDYRTVDMPISEGDLPGKVPTAMVGDAWLGVFKSYDGGESWTSTMLPGFPQDPSANPLKNYRTAADPVVRSGPNGLFYYSGIAFNRDTNLGVVFVARFIDNNDKEGGDTIEYIDTKIIASGTATKFLDKPWIAVDQPRIPFTNIKIAGQTFPRHNVYIAYSSFSGTKVTLGDVMFVRSTNCGTNWGTPIKISTGNFAHQGATIAIKPVLGEVLVAWRRFAQTNKSPDQIYVAQSFSRGANFQSPIKVANIPPFDQPTTDETQSLPGTGLGFAFRTNSYPTITVDKSGHVYLAWSQRGVGAGGGARVMLSSSYLGSNWTSPRPIDPSGLSFLGHQVMPSLSFAAGKLILVWYDQRNDVSGEEYGYNNWILDDMAYRHTMDVWAAEADTDTYPSLAWNFTQVSRYLYSVLRDDSGDIIFEDGNPIIFPVQFNCVNYPLFKGGHNPFMGDYIDVAASPSFRLDTWRNWIFNTDSSNSPVFHVAWTDNRDVRPPLPPYYDWTVYTPPNYSNSNFDTPGRTNCSQGGSGNEPGMRNQNIYTSRITWGIEAGSPTNDKPLNLDVGRAFVVFVKNNTEFLRSYRLTIADQPTGGQASFLQFDLLTTLDVNIAPYSTISRPVFIDSSDINASVTINIDEIDASGNIIAGGLKSSVLMNGDPSNPNVPIGEETHNPNIVNQANPNIVNWYVNPNIVNPNIVNPNIVNPNIVNPNIVNPNIVNPNIVNPNIVNPNIVNPNIVNPNIVNRDVANPNIVNPNIVNPNIVNPNIVNAALEDVSITDVEWTVRNDGNVTTSFTLKTLSKKSPPEGVYAQLLVYRVHLTPAVAGAELSSSEDISACELKQEPHHELILNVVNPNIVNPNIVNPNIVNPNIVNASIENATFSVAPGEEVIVDLRVLDTGVAPSGATTFKTLSSKSSLQAFDVQDFIGSLGFAVTSQAVNSVDAAQGIETPPAAATTLVIGTPSLPDGVVNTGYTATLQAYGGDGTYYWNLNSGELPPGLSLGSGGTITGTPLTPGIYYFIVRVDSGDEFDTQQYTIYIDSDGTVDPLTITTASLPSGVLSYWYGATLEATGGVWPRTWSLAGGSLPPGLGLDPAGVISGTIELEVGQDYPTTYNFSVIVTDNTGYSTAPKALSIYVNLATGDYVTISGMVFDENGDPLGGVVMRGLPNTPITGADTPGFYEDKVPEFWSGTVEPFKAGYSFSPPSRTYSVLGSSQSSQDYSVGAIPTPPEINLRLTIPGLPAKDIPDGGSFDFGPFGGESYALFTIENLGGADLTITTPLTITGPDSDQFSVTEPPSSPVAPGETTTFEIRFIPTSEEAPSASIAIVNNDADENPYDLALIATATSKIQAETAADGSGTLVPAQNVPSGSMISVYAISRDAGGNFIENVAADSWSLVNITGGVVATDLAVWEGYKGAFFAGNSPGTAQIRATKSGFTSVDSGVLTVTESETYEFVTEWGSSGTGDREFGVPFGIAIDSSGNVYVCDDGNHRIQKFNSGGTLLGWWGLDNLGNTGWHEPGSGRTGVAGSGNGQFNRPLGIAIDGSGMVYVTDTQNLRVQKFDSMGTYLSQWVGGAGGFSWPLGIAVDTSGYVYVCDTFRNRVQKFTSIGGYVSEWVTGTNPRGIAYDSSQACFYVSDGGDAPSGQSVAIKKFNSNWELLTSWGSYGTGDSQFNEIGYPSVSSSGYVYVPDSMNNRVQVFSLDGQFLSKFGGSEGWGNPWGIAINNSLGYIYITDQSYKRVQVWRKVG